jgi:hypothetical protein
MSDTPAKPPGKAGDKPGDKAAEKAAPGAAGGAAVSPEAEAMARIKALQAQITVLNQDSKIIEGKLANRDPKLVAKLESENAFIKARIEKLELAIGAVFTRSNQPTSLDDLKTQYEILRSAAVEYFKKNNVDAELWKNIVS